MAAVILAAELPGARGGGLAWAAAVAVAFAREADAARAAGDDGAVLLVEIGGRAGPRPDDARRGRRQGAGARAARGRLRGRGPGPARVAAARRGRGLGRAGGGGARALRRGRAPRSSPCRRTCCARCSTTGDSAPGRGAAAGGAAAPAAARGARCLANCARRASAPGSPRGRPGGWRRAGRSPGSIPAARSRAARRASRAGCCGPVRRARVAPAAAERAWRRSAGQALPLVLGGILALVFCTLLLAALGGAVTGKSRVQRAADLAALSAARSMRDDFDRLFAPARLPGGTPNPEHLAKASYLARASAAAADAAHRNGVAEGRLRIEFPGRRVIRAAAGAGGGRCRTRYARAPAARCRSRRRPRRRRLRRRTAGTGAAPSVASGGGYSGPLVYPAGRGNAPRRRRRLRSPRRRGARRRARAAGQRRLPLRRRAGRALGENPDPRWVAPPGTSLHRCATELDLGPPAAYGWLAANARRLRLPAAICVGGVALRLRRRSGAVLARG